MPTMRCALIRPTPTLDRMSDKTSDIGGREPRRYEILVGGPIGETIMQAFPTLTATRRGPDTVLIGPLADQSALYGVIHQLEDLGLQLLDIRRLPTDDPEPRVA